MVQSSLQYQSEPKSPAAQQRAFARSLSLLPVPVTELIPLFPPPSNPLMMNAIWDPGGSTCDVGAGFLSVALLFSLGPTAGVHALCR